MTQLSPEQLAQVEEGLALLLRGHQRLDPLDPDDEPDPLDPDDEHESFRALIQLAQERVKDGPRHGEPCPHCESGDQLRVLETRRAPGGKRRRIQCLACGERFTTWQPTTPPLACYHCGSSDQLRVLETRRSPGGKRRRVQCLACGKRFTTWQPDPLLPLHPEAS